MDAAVRGTLGREVPPAGFRGGNPLIYSSRNLGTVAWGDRKGRRQSRKLRDVTDKPATPGLGTASSFLLYVGNDH